MTHQNRLQKLIRLGALLLLSGVPMSAQNSLPSPHDASCWESLSTLQACAIEQYNRAIDQAERCSSYPEYQCMPVPEEDSRSAEAAMKKNSATPSNRANTTGKSQATLSPTAPTSASQRSGLD